VWRTHFQARKELKNRTLDIFRELHGLASTHGRAVASLQQQSSHLTSQMRRAQENEQAMVRQLKRVELHHAKLLDTRRCVAERGVMRSALRGTWCA
jgi:hypothetical protein